MCGREGGETECVRRGGGGGDLNLKKVLKFSRPWGGTRLG